MSELAGSFLQEPDAGEDCPYCRITDKGGELDTVSRKCRAQDCHVCMLIDHCELLSCIELGMNKNASLATKLQMSKHVAHISNSGEIDAEPMAVITKALCLLLSCKQTTLKNIARCIFHWYDGDKVN